MRHSDIQDEQIGLIGLAETDGFQPIGCLGDYVQPKGLENANHCLPDNLVIICDDSCTTHT
jgi:hypothetical protein